MGKAEPFHHGLGHALAAPPVKRKRIHQHRPDLLFQLIANELPRPVQPGFDGFRLDTEKLRRFLDAHSLDHPCDEHLSKGFRQIVSRLLDKLKDLPLCHRSFRIIVEC